MSAMIFKKTVTNKTKIKKMLSPSQSILKVPVNKGSQAFLACAERCGRFTLLSQNR